VRWLRIPIGGMSEARTRPTIWANPCDFLFAQPEPVERPQPNNLERQSVERRPKQVKAASQPPAVDSLAAGSYACLAWGGVVYMYMIAQLYFVDCRGRYFQRRLAIAFSPRNCYASWLGRFGSSAGGEKPRGLRTLLLDNLFAS
jgi:hypothetical protein